MSFQWEVPPDRAFDELASWYTDAIRSAILQLAQQRAPQIEAWMKANARWTDRTGNARQTLTAEAELLGMDAVQITLAHGVDYGIFLELAHGGRWAVIGPALDFFAPRIWADVQALLRR